MTFPTLAWIPLTLLYYDLLCYDLLCLALRQECKMEMDKEGFYLDLDFYIRRHDNCIALRRLTDDVAFL